LGFEKKKAIFGKSDIETTKSLSKNNSWSRKEIEHRQAYMASKAADIWRVNS
jgi:hypothetical protein